MTSGSSSKIGISTIKAALRLRSPNSAKETKIENELDKLRGTQEIDKKESDAIAAQGKSFVIAKKGDYAYKSTLQNVDNLSEKYDKLPHKDKKELINVAKESYRNIKGAENLEQVYKVKALKESLPKDEKIETFRKCLISNQYLMMQKMEKIDDLSKYTSQEFNIIKEMYDFEEEANPLITPKVKEFIMKEIFGEDFYNTNILKLQNEINKLSDEDKKRQLIDVNKELESKIETSSCGTKIDTLCEYFEMFEMVYSQIMKGDGLEKLAKNRAIELCFAKRNSYGFASSNHNMVSMLSSNPTWSYLVTELKSNKKKLESTMVHELTHYTQYLLKFSKIHESKLSKQAKQAMELFNKPYINYLENFKKYVLNPMEIGARATEILSQLEKTCGFEYGEFCFQEKGTDEARKEHAQKIVTKLDKYLQREKGQSLCEFLNDKAQENDTPVFLCLLDLCASSSLSMHEMIKCDEKLQLTSKQLKNSDITQHIEECFEHLLEYIIPREDMRTIAQELGSNDKSFIETEKKISNQINIQKQINDYEAQIQLFEDLQKKMQTQDGSICLPSVNYLSEQIKNLEEKQDIKTYKQLNTKLEEAKVSNKDTKKLLKQIKETSTMPIVESYLYLNELLNQSRLVDLSNKLHTVDVNNPQEAKKKIDELKVQIQKFGNDTQKSMFKELSNIINKLEENTKLKGMSLKDKQKYIKANELEVTNENKLLLNIKNYQTIIKLLKSINNGAKDIYINRDWLKKIFKNDNKINQAIEYESKALKWYNIINNLKNCNVKQKINYFTQILTTWKQFPKVKKVLEDYKNNALSKPDEEPKLFNNVLKVFNDLYNDAKVKTNHTILVNPDNPQKIGTYITQYNNRLEQLNNNYTNRLNEAIDNYAKKLKSNISNKATGSLKTAQFSAFPNKEVAQEKLDKYKAEKEILSDIKSKMSNILYNRYTFERNRNEDSNMNGQIDDFKQDLMQSFLNLSMQLEKLPQAIQAKLKFYSNWAQRGFEKFQYWTKALTK